MPSPLEVADDRWIDPTFDTQVTGREWTRIERADQMPGVERRRIDRRLEPEPVINDAEQEREAPLILPIATG